MKNDKAMTELVIALSLFVKQFLGGSEEHMLKLRTVYPYGLNEKVDTLRSLIDVPPPLIKL